MDNLFTYLGIALGLIALVVIYVFSKNKKINEALDEIDNEPVLGAEAYTSGIDPYKPEEEDHIQFQGEEPEEVSTKERFAQTVYMYMIDDFDNKKFQNFFESLRQAEKVTGISRHKIKKSCTEGSKIKNKESIVIFTYKKL